MQTDTPAPRKIIQISSSSETEDRFAAIVALCNDGSVWRMVAKLDAAACSWSRV